MNREAREIKSITFHIQDLWPSSTLIYPEGGSLLINDKDKGSLKIIEDIPKVLVHMEPDLGIYKESYWQNLDIRKVNRASRQVYINLSKLPLSRFLSLVRLLFPACSW